MADPEHGKVYTLPGWVEKSGGKPWQADPWTEGRFPSDMTVGGEGFPVGTYATAGNSHNADPRQTLLIQTRDPVNYTRNDSRPFREIAGGYQPIGAAHVLIHRDYPWQAAMLKVIAVGTDGRLVRVYTWWYLEFRQYRWTQTGIGEGFWSPL